MIASGFGGLISNFVRHGGLLVLLVVVGAVAVSYRRMSRRLQTSGWLAAAALFSIGSILAITLGVRVFDAGGVGFGLPRLSCLDTGVCLNRAVEIDASWLLNLAIFVPAGFFSVLASRRTLALFIALIGLSIGIEVVQGVFRLGAPDPGDIFANTLGSLIGVALGAAVLRITAQPGGRQTDLSRTLGAMAFTFSVAIVFGWLALATAANSQRASLADEIMDVFAGTAAADIASAMAADNGFDGLLAAVSTRPDYLGQVGESNDYAARYSMQFLGFNRCVFVYWDAAGVTLTNGAGQECTVFRDRPPG